METKMKSTVTPDGFVLSTEFGGVIGYKCLICSTTHVPTEEELDKMSEFEFVAYIVAVKESHASCREMVR